MTFPLFPPEAILLFILLFLRVSAMVIVIPVLGDTASSPARVKAGLVILISFLIFPTLLADSPPIQTDWGLFTLAFAMAGEIMVGVIIGFTARFIFAGIQLAGEINGIQMGFAMANVFDPVSRINTSSISNFQYRIALLVYLAVDGHHIFIMAIADSFQILPPLGMHFSPSLMKLLLTYSSAIFVTAVKVSAPIMAVLLFLNVALGIVARTVPQINVFIVGLPIQMATGLIIFGLTAPLFAQFIQRAISGLPNQIRAVLQLMAV